MITWCLILLLSLRSVSCRSANGLFPNQAPSLIVLRRSCLPVVLYESGIPSSYNLDVLAIAVCCDVIYEDVDDGFVERLSLDGDSLRERGLPMRFGLRPMHPCSSSSRWLGVNLGGEIPRPVKNEVLRRLTSCKEGLLER